MTAVLDVARLQLGAWRWIVFGWVILALSFSINFVIATLADTSFTSGGVAVIPVFALIMSSALLSSWWPFASGLSVTRARFYQANLLVALVVGAGTGLALLALAAVEGATGGWGASLVYFGVFTPWVAGPAQEWLVLVSVFLLAWADGLLFAAIHKRWGSTGTVISIGTVVVVPGAVVALVTVLDAWPSVGRWVGSQTVTGMVVGFGLLTAVIVGAGWLVLRRAAP
ncbi:hypothetical protein [Aquipuribacter sp. MA13-6]|uniref:hypothetical protein n=1 Tax=unclassified Aquipuribacter TaxID=2635084 RepID=UPI003EEC0CC9